MVRDVIEQRKKTGEVRRDFIQLLMELKEKGRITPEDEEIKSDTHEEQITSKIGNFFYHNLICRYMTNNLD
jgi:argonaute-like protein implicated in RNA metabolism and viral defense